MYQSAGDPLLALMAMLPQLQAGGPWGARGMRQRLGMWPGTPAPYIGLPGGETGPLLPGSGYAPGNVLGAGGALDQLGDWQGMGRKKRRRWLSQQPTWGGFQQAGLPFGGWQPSPMAGINSGALTALGGY